MGVINTYDEYLEKTKSITFEKMTELHRNMLKEIGTDEDALELYEELIKSSTKYAAIRANWLLLSREEKMDTDSRRTSCHNSVIIKFNQLARYLKMQGRDVKWRDELGYEEDDRYNRKTVGDFACYLVFVNSVNAR